MLLLLQADVTLKLILKWKMNLPSSFMNMHDIDCVNVILASLSDLTKLPNYTEFWWNGWILTLRQGENDFVDLWDIDYLYDFTPFLSLEMQSKCLFCCAGKKTDGSTCTCTCSTDEEHKYIWLLGFGQSLTPQPAAFRTRWTHFIAGVMWKAEPKTAVQSFPETVKFHPVLLSTVIGKYFRGFQLHWLHVLSAPSLQWIRNLKRKPLNVTSVMC